MSQLLWLEVFVNTFISALIIVAGFIIGKGVKRTLTYLIFRLGVNEWFKRFAIGRAIIRSGYAPSEFFGMVASWVIYILSFFLSAMYLSQQLALWYVYDVFSSLLGYLYSFVRAFIIIVVGYILVDS
ncbi:MAG: hypothetical protein QW808_02845, partial [Desulfurococcaceae archaeon]